MTRCLIAIGSNQGNCRQNIESAISEIDRLPDTHVLLASPLVTTTPVGIADRIFLNGAVLVETALPARTMMGHLLRIETDGGRDRRQESGNRPIDLDILLFGDQVHSESATRIDSDSPKDPLKPDDEGFDLYIPHPRMSFRRFVLEPAIAIAPGMRHPVLGRTLGQLLQHIRESKNIVFVFALDKPDRKTAEEVIRPSDGFSPSEHDPEIEWLFSDHRQEWKAAIDPLPVCDQAGQPWLVLVTSQLRLLREYVATAKLLVTVGDAGLSDDCAFELERFNGPRWSLDDGSGERLLDCVLAAIESLEPIVPVKSDGDG